MKDRAKAVAAGLRIPTTEDCLVCHREKGSHVAVHKLPALEEHLRACMVKAFPEGVQPKGCVPVLIGQGKKGELTFTMDRERPSMKYDECLFNEKNVRSVTANTRRDGEELLREAARILSEWNLCASAESAGAALYEAFSEKLIENTFRDDMGPALFDEVSRTSRILWNAMDRAVARGDSLFFENVETEYVNHVERR